MAGGGGTRYPIPLEPVLRARREAVTLSPHLSPQLWDQAVTSTSEGLISSWSTSPGGATHTSGRRKRVRTTARCRSVTPWTQQH